VWSWTNSGSIHRAAWPTREEIVTVSGTDESAKQAVVHVTEALNVIRKGKVDSKVSIGTPVQQIVYSSTDEAIACLNTGRARPEGRVAHRRLDSEGRRRAVR
jgi:valyl-tRNA synthetase